MKRKPEPYKRTAWALLRDGEFYMALPNAEEAHTHYSMLSLHGHSKHKWTVQKCEVRFPFEMPTERRKRFMKHVDDVVALNKAIESQFYSSRQRN